jgi:hypothetical protein
MLEIVEHLREPYRVYCIHLDPGVNKRPSDAMITFHIGRPVSFKTLCSNYIFQHMELTVQKTGHKIPVGDIVGVQKISNQNKPTYELRMDGTFIEL